MEKAVDWEQKTLLNELTQGKELAKQLRKHLNPSSSLETRQFLVDKILHSYEKALSMLNCSGFLGEQKSTVQSFANSSPRSDVSDQDCKDQCHKDAFKKRKIQPRWTEQVKVCSGSGLDGPLDDGYSWRKYGQKDILGANFPRGYYRCTHRHSQGCLATKQVQKSDQDPTIFEVTYRGRHTCMQASYLAKESAFVKNEMSSQNKNHCQQQQVEEQPKAPEQVLINIGEQLNIKTEDLNTREEIFPSFSFPSASMENEIEENNFFNESMMENSVLGSLSPTFISPATSESNYFSMSQCDINNFGIGHTVQTPESGLTEIISAPTSVANSPIEDLEITFDIADFDSNFPFDNSELLA